MQANLTNLYSKVKFLKEIEATTQPGAKSRMSLGYEEVTHSRRRYATEGRQGQDHQP
ncbi:MAG: hypothetical protein MZV63_42750 [Marinilabiliales bacterium]|nr:hypothetical protein [Marinilabiliales bacterium]